VSQLPQRQVNLSLNGRGVPLNILQAWGWPALPVSGDGNLQLTASGSVQADAPLKPTVNGQLSAMNMEKQQVAQVMRNGRSPAPSPFSAGDNDSLTSPLPLLPTERGLFHSRNLLQLSGYLYLFPATCSFQISDLL
jgi:hypothetical protein